MYEIYLKQFITVPFSHQIDLEIFPNHISVFDSPASAVEGDRQQPASTPSSSTTERTVESRKQMINSSYSSPTAHCLQFPAYICLTLSQTHKNTIDNYYYSTSRLCLMKEPGLQTAFQNIIKMPVNLICHFM